VAIFDNLFKEDRARCEKREREALYVVDVLLHQGEMPLRAIVCRQITSQAIPDGVSFDPGMGVTRVAASLVLTTERLLYINGAPPAWTEFPYDVITYAGSGVPGSLYVGFSFWGEDGCLGFSGNDLWSRRSVDAMAEAIRELAHVPDWYEARVAKQSPRDYSAGHPVVPSEQKRAEVLGRLSELANLRARGDITGHEYETLRGELAAPRGAETERRRPHPGPGGPPRKRRVPGT